MKNKILTLMFIAGLLCSCAHSSTVTLEWEPPEQNVQIGYSIFMLPDNLYYFKRNITSFTFTDVPEDRLVYFKVIATKYKNDGTGWAHVMGWWYEHGKLMPTHLVLWGINEHTCK